MIPSVSRTLWSVISTPMPAILQVRYEIADLVDRDRVDAGERLVQQYVGRLRRQRAGDLDPAPLAAGQRQRRRAAQMADAELAQQFVQHVVALVRGRARPPRAPPSRSARH